jgi:DNA processing protein
MTSQEKQAILRLIATPKLGVKTYLKIIEEYGSPLKFLYDKETSNIRINYDIPYHIDLQGDYILYGQDIYPYLLKNINDPPLILFYEGNVELLRNNKLIAVVGTRNISSYGKKATIQIVKELVNRQYTIVSGLAYGVDMVAHETALEYGGNTIAVLGTTLKDAKLTNKINLYNKIKKNSLIITEYDNFLNKADNVGSFPRRNRIIAGLCSKTIVTEAPIKSGALITANLAFDYNREVYAVPGDYDRHMSQGCNFLIHNNKATIYTNISNLDYLINEPLRKTDLDLSYDERYVYDTLNNSGKSTFDQLMTKINNNKININLALSMLEIKKIVAKDNLGYYTLYV